VTLTISYSIAFLGPLLGGSLWDLSHLPAFAFLPVAVASLVLIVLGAVLPERRAFFAKEEDAIA
jgi:CP family cyanate transporter-like MFS transporter